jgi:hypothetical protein
VNYLQHAQTFGAAAILYKPFRPAELLDVVSHLLAAETALEVPRLSRPAVSVTEVDEE